MKLEIEYTIQLTCTEEQAPEIEKALLAKAKEFDAAADCNETDCQEMQDNE